MAVPTEAERHARTGVVAIAIIAPRCVTVMMVAPSLITATVTVTNEADLFSLRCGADINCVEMTNRHRGSGSRKSNRKGGGSEGESDDVHGCSLRDEHVQHPKAQEVPNSTRVSGLATSSISAAEITAAMPAEKGVTNPDKDASRAPTGAVQTSPANNQGTNVAGSGHHPARCKLLTCVRPSGLPATATLERLR